MKTKHRRNNFRETLRGIFRRCNRRHDSMLMLNLSIFNFSDDWNRTFEKYEYARFLA